jgi:hypothetical protein
MSSHVLLAACQNEEMAFEMESGGKSSGVFTTALLETLETHILHDSTYSDLIDHFPGFLNQHPYCEGFGKTRIMFGTIDPGIHNLAMFSVFEERGKYYVGAGRIQGIFEGTELIITTSSRPKLLVTATVVEDFRCEVKPQEPASGVSILGSRAAVSNWNRPFLRNPLLPWDRFNPTGRRAGILDSDRYHDIRVTEPSDDGHYQLERCDPLILTYAMLSVTLTAHQSLSEVLLAASHFNFFLYHGSSHNALASTITVRLQTGENMSESHHMSKNLFRAAKGLAGSKESNMASYLSKTCLW